MKLDQHSISLTKNNIKRSDFITYAAAAYPILWVDTCEYDRAIIAYTQELYNLKMNGYAWYDIYSWDMVTGFQRYNYNMNDFRNYESDKDENKDPLAPITLINELCNQQDDQYTSIVVFVKNYHIFLKAPEIYQSLLNSINKFNKNMVTLVIVSPVVDIPVELKRYITILDFSLPDKQILSETLSNMITSFQASADNEEDIIASGSGLTLLEFKNAICKSIVSNNRKILANSVHEQKRQLIRQNNAMDIVKSEYGFERIIGLDNLKFFTSKMVGKKNSKAVLLVGCPGTGKSAFAKALGKELGRLTISLDIGNLQGSLVGQTEQNTKDALAVIDAMQPAILFLDEIEKSLAAVSNSAYAGDSGVGKRQGGYILQWLNDHTSDIYTIATCNNIDTLPPEYLRAGRWDAIFYIGLPTEEERQGLLDLYKQIYEVDDDSIIASNLENWTGAEIESLCKLAHNLEISLKEARNFVCPMIQVSHNEIDAMIKKLEGIAVPASKYAVQKHMLDVQRGSFNNIPIADRKITLI